MPEENML